jgi:hypothetical protein
MKEQRIEERETLVFRICLGEEEEGGREQGCWPLEGGRAGRTSGGRIADLSP